MASQLSERDLEIVQKVFQCFKDPETAMKVDTTKLAELAGFKSRASANASWLVIKKKLMGTCNAPDSSNSNGDEDTPAKAKPAPKKRVSKLKAEADADAPADDEQTPVNTPKAKGGVKRKAPAAKASTADDNDNNVAGETVTDAVAADGDENTEDLPVGTPGKKGGAKRKAIDNYTEDDNDEPAVEEDDAAVIKDGHEEAADGPPAKKKRVYNRKPKDAKAPAAPKGKNTVKKGGKAREMKLEPINFGHYHADSSSEELYSPIQLPPWHPNHPNNGCGPGWEPWNNVQVPFLDFD